MIGTKIVVADGRHDSAEDVGENIEAHLNGLRRLNANGHGKEMLYCKSGGDLDYADDAPQPKNRPSPTFR